MARAFNMELNRNGLTNIAATIAEGQKQRKMAYTAQVVTSGDGRVANAAANNAQADSRRVMVIPIMGVMTRYGDACSYGTEDTAAWIDYADKNKDVAAIVLEMESGGGEVNGTQQLGEVIAATKKPVVAFVKGMAASAAYWAASQADVIIMETGPVSEVGSIGVLMVHGELATYEEKNGAKYTIIRADGSENKALVNMYEPINADLIKAEKAAMKPMRDAFIKAVKKGRGDKLTKDDAVLEDVFSGNMFTAKDAIKYGLADEVGTFDDAIKKAWEMR